MRKLLQIILPISFFFLVFLAFNYFIFYNLSSIFRLPETGTFYILVLIAAISFPVSLTLEKLFSNSLTRAIYTISATWLGISIYLLILLIIYEISGLLIKIPAQIAGIIIITIAFIASIYALLNANRLETEEVNIHLNGLRNDVRAVQLSDVHIGPIRNLKFINRIVDKTNQLKPDIILITGDLFDGTSKLHKYIPMALNKFEAPTLFVTGNHDNNQGLEEVFQILNAAHVNILKNEVFQFNDLQVVGVDYSLKKGHLDKTLKEIQYDKNKPTILMYHLPREFEVTKEAGIQLQLSGHTHDGQFFPLNYLVKLMFPYIRGLYEYQGAYLYVSQGTGTWGPPMRLGSRCEITLIKLKSQCD